MSTSMTTWVPWSVTLDDQHNQRHVVRRWLKYRVITIASNFSISYPSIWITLPFQSIPMRRPLFVMI